MLGLSFEGEVGDYQYTDRLDGMKHLGLWQLAEAAQACFGRPEWPEGAPLPQATIEFDAESPDAVHEVRTEPRGQTLARLLSPEGLLVGIAYTPDLHES